MLLVRFYWNKIINDPNDPAYKSIARNLMRDMKKGDYAFFYHSNCKTPGVVGVMEIVQEHSVDGSNLLIYPLNSCL
jgi:predicted RNA-binding protein with PUA-like domain